MSAKAAQADLYPLARPYFLFWLPNAADQYNQAYLAGSPIGMASDDPTAARNPTTGALLAAGSLVAGTDGILYVVDTSGVPQPQPYLSGALTWTGLQTFGGGATLLDGDVLTMGTGADVTWTPDGTNVVLAGAGAVLAHDSKLLIVDPADTTKRARLDAGAVTAGQTRVVSVPDADVSLDAATRDAIATCALANATAGATDALLSVQLTQVDGATLAAARQFLLQIGPTQYNDGAGPSNASLSLGTITAGSVVATCVAGSLYLVETSAAGLFACTATNTDDETVYVSAKTAVGGVSDLAKRCSIVGSNSDAGAWSA